MKHAIFLLGALLLASPVSAACFADYKAKQDDPLRLHYGVAKIPDAKCTRQQAAKALRKRVAKDGWELLNVVSVFDETKVDAKKGNAGDYFLRY
ncbi:MAG: hypothetical protein ABJO67_15125 [Pseudoruegeria sp.]